MERFRSARGNFTVQWRADEVNEQILEATLMAAQDTADAAADEAGADHPSYPPASLPYTRYADRSGGTSAGIFAGEAIIDPDDWVWVEWGVVDVVPALFLEFGTSKMAPRPFLYPAWDNQKVLFGLRIKEYMAMRAGTSAAAFRAGVSARAGQRAGGIGYGKVGKGGHGRFVSLQGLTSRGGR